MRCAFFNLLAVSWICPFVYSLRREWSLTPISSSFSWWWINTRGVSSRLKVETKLLLQYCQWRAVALLFAFHCCLHWTVNEPVDTSCWRGRFEGMSQGGEKNQSRGEAFLKTLAHQARPEDQNHCIPERKKKKGNEKNAIHAQNDRTNVAHDTYVHVIYFNMKQAPWNLHGLQEVRVKTQLLPEKRKSRGKR